MKIQLKRSNVLESGAAKQPTAGQMEYGELAVNYNTNDPAIFLKDSNNQIIRIAGAGYDYNDLDNLPTIGDGEITIEDADGTEVGSFTVNQTGDATITLPAGFSGDYDDLTNTPTIGDAEITIEQNSVTLGTFTVNQTGDTTITLPDTATIYPPSTSEPGSPNNGDIWIDSNECPPVLKIWSDCDGNGQWYDLTASTPKPIEPSPGDGNSSISPTPPGSGTEIDPYVLTAKVVNYGGSTTTDETITFSNQKVGALVQFVDQNSGTNGARYTQPVGVVGADGTWSGKLTFTDSPATDTDTDYIGLLKIGSSSIYYSWTVTSETSVIPPPVITQNPAISSGSGYTNDPITVDTRAAVTNATFTSSAWLKDGALIPGATSTTSYTPTAAGKYVFREVFTGDDASTVNADSNEVEVEVDLTTANATVHGLRFDPNRKTNLVRSSSGGLGEHTFSCWIKPTDFPTFQRLFIIDRPMYSQVALDENGDVRYGNFSVFLGASTSSLTLNKWNHLVVKVTSNEVFFYIDGVDVSPGGITPVDQTGPGDLSFILGSDTGDSSYFDGYLSDVYFVDGEALEPETFGHSYEGKWGPLDSSVVLNSIKGSAKAPYENRPNMAQRWSDGITGDANSTRPLAFDGDIANKAYANSLNTGGSAELIWTNQHNVSGSVWRMYIYVGTSRDVTNTYQVDSGTIYYGWEEKEEWTSGLYAWVTIPDAPETPGSIKINATTNSGSPYLAAIEVDGRILVDGPADNSQNWSDSATAASGWNTSGNGFGPDRAFDGITGADDVNARAITSTGDGIFNFPAIPFSKLRLWVGADHDSAASAGKLEVNNIDVKSQITTWSKVGAWYEITGVGSFLTSITIGRPAGNVYTSLFAVEVTGADNIPKLLIDAGAQWDQSQVWSDGGAGQEAAGFPWTKAFDGVVTGAASSYSAMPLATDDGGVGEMTWTGNIEVPAGKTVKLYYWYQTLNLDRNYIEINNNKITLNSTDGSNDTIQQIDITTEAGTAITQMKVVRGAGNNHATAIAGISVDDKILVDAGSIGNSGFYLPFDPAQTGQVWTDYLTSSDGLYRDNNTPDKAFNGDDGSTFCEANLGGLDSLLTFEPPTNSFTGILDVEVIGAKSTGQTIWVFDKDGNDYALSDNENTWTATDIDGVTKIEARGVNNPASYCDIRRISIGGNLLVNHSSIGVDASGQGNHFHDQNFGLGDSVYTGVVTGTPAGGSSWSNVFNGTKGKNNSETVSTTSGNGETTMTLANTFSGQVTVYASANTGTGDPAGAEVVLTHAGGTKSIPCAALATGNPEKDHGIDAGTLTDVSAITLKAPANGTKLYWIELDGSLLVDGNIQDTVKDTPMRNYAVLDSSRKHTVNDQMFNGNLQVTVSDSSAGLGASTFVCQPNSGKYYYEAMFQTNGINGYVGIRGATDINYDNVNAYRGDGQRIYQTNETTFGDPFTNGDVISAVIDMDAATVGFYKNGSYQGLAATDITYPVTSITGFFNTTGGDNTYTVNFGQQPFAYATDNGDGTVTLKDTSPNIDEKWSDGVALATNPEQMFDGDLTNNGAETGMSASAFVNFEQHFGVINVNESLEFYGQSGDQVYIFNDDPTTQENAGSGWYKTNFTGQLKRLEWKHGSGGKAFITGVRIDGRLLVDGPADNSQVWSDSLTSSNGFEDGAEAIYAFDGDAVSSRSKVNTDGVMTFAPSTQVNFTTKLEVNAFGGTIKLGESGSGTLIGNTETGWTTVVNGSGTISSSAENKLILTSTAGEKAGLRAIRIDDKLLIDAPDTGPFQTLSQTWQQYARTTLGYALDRIAKMEALRLMDAATIEDLRTQIAGALSRIASIESDEVNDDAVDNSLITLVGSLSSQITAWSERIETAETNLSALTSRVTTLES